MTNTFRRQLTLFINKKDAENIESIRSTYNAAQSELIAAHVTLCRENEIEDINQVVKNLTENKLPAILIQFGAVTRFENGKGVLLPATIGNATFDELRKQVLKSVLADPKRHEAHITLLHPRNASCTDEIFDAIKKIDLPAQLYFNSISLIEQVNGGKWQTIRSFALASV